MNIDSYPLSWPAGWRRTAPEARQRARFGKLGGGSGRTLEQLTIADGTRRILDALRRMGVHSNEVIVSTNMPVRNDGMPYSGRKAPADPGVAIYWREKHMGPDTPYRCMAIDIYDRLADNLAAVAATLECLRGIERQGGAEILSRAFEGFIGLPDKASTGWWVELGVMQDAPHHEVRTAYMTLRGKHHPDRGGDPDVFQRIQRAWELYQSAKNGDN